MTPYVRLLLATVGVIYLLKAVAMWTRRGPRSFAGLGYSFSLGRA